MEYSIGELIDELSVVNIKIYHLVDVVEGGGKDSDVARAAVKITQLNRRRSELKNAINKVLGGREEIKT